MSVQTTFATNPSHFVANMNCTMTSRTPNLKPSYVDLIWRSPNFREQHHFTYYYWDITTVLHLQVIDRNEYDKIIREMSKYKFLNPVTYENRDSFEFQQALDSWTGHAQDDKEDY